MFERIKALVFGKARVERTPVTQQVRRHLPPNQEWLVWIGNGEGAQQVGKSIKAFGKVGKVIDGTILYILVQWEE